jgi:DNA-binding NtrC family response regulator
MKEKFDGLIEYLLEKGFFLVEAVECLEKCLITRALEKTNGNRSAAAKVLGIHRNTLQRKREEYKLVAHAIRRKPPRRAEGAGDRPRARAVK